MSCDEQIQSLFQAAAVTGALRLLVLSIVWIDSATTATWADQEPLRTYNDLSCTW